MSAAVADVLIVGAGLAGAGAAFVLARAGLKVVLVDQFATQAPVFKAEKIEPDQAGVLRTLGLMDAVLPVCTRIHRVACGQEGRIWNCLPIEEYGVFYHDLVNALRQRLPDSVRFVAARVEKLTTSSARQSVSLSDGTLLQARLLVLAAGAVGKMPEQLGMVRDTRSAAHSLSLGFNLEPLHLFPGHSESLTYRENRVGPGIDYLTLFPIGPVLRANMFCYWEIKDPKFQELKSQGMSALQHWLPGLAAITGPLQISSRVEAMPIHLYRFENVAQPGVVLLGDLFQSVCPATGTGLTKVLADIQALLEVVPGWLQTPDLGPEKIAQYYRNPHKRATDDNSLADAFYRKRLCSDPGLSWTARRWKKYFPRRIAALHYRPPSARESAAA